MDFVSGLSEGLFNYSSPAASSGMGQAWSFIGLGIGSGVNYGYEKLDLGGAKGGF